MKRKTLVDAWAQLDIKEEAELRSTNKIFEDLKNHFDSGIHTQEDVKFELAITQQLEKLQKEEAKGGALSVTTRTSELKRNRTTLSEISASNPVTLDWVTDMIDQFKEGKTLQESNVLHILSLVEPILRAEPNVATITIKPNSRLTIVGDLHGQYDDLLTIFKLNGMPNERHPWIFNGDFVDRGQHSAECVLTLFAFKILYPHTVHLNRGNHEARDLNSRDGFEKEIKQKYDGNMFNLFSETFAALPLAAVVDETTLVVHGGLFYDDVKMQEIHDFHRFHAIPPPETLMEDMLWSDPCLEPGRYENSRGCACEFGPDVVDRFFENNPPLNRIIRSHECEDTGYAEWFGGKLYTVFSCSNYQGNVGNDATYCVLEKGRNPRFIRYYAQKDLKAGHLHHTAGLEQAIVTKLLTRIATCRLGLINQFREEDKQKTGHVTREIWSSCLTTVLGLHIPFLQFQEYLGLPELGVDGKKDGPIDYMDFCNRYVVANPMASATGSTDTFFKEMMDVMYARRYELESLFTFFDTDGDGSISRDEFKTGLASLATVLGKTFTEEQVYQLVDAIDSNHDGQIDFQEFLTKFETDMMSVDDHAKVNERRSTYPRSALPNMGDVKIIDTHANSGSVSQGQGLGRTRKLPLKRFRRAANKIINVNRFRLAFTKSSD
jgi:diadenosine tetraphosphatase ApaH/serine/threonine PP2A family protein phosphatase